MEHLATKARESHSMDIELSSKSEEFNHSLQSSESGVMCRSQVLNRKLHSKYTVQERREKLRAVAPEVSHENMIKLLLKLRLRVQIQVCCRSFVGMLPWRLMV